MLDSSVVTKSIEKHLSQSAGNPIIFCGDASIASKVSDSHDVTYVDSSMEALKEVQSQYSGIRKTAKADVLDYIYFNASSSLVIFSEVSAGWHHSFQMEKLITAIERNRYKLVVLEFLDEEATALSSGSGIKLSTFNKKQLLSSLGCRLRRYSVELQPSLSSEDTSFTLVIRKK
ncbi:hypothetical protein L3Q72_05650 [Vibrio sp. JC009]|uniref:hypothetical protein n=1 Tax=Vibrio sp. JC009 TaxID=2912314 RepID=UPI0023B0070A|nr:hypothetical protein [Vibrio sp. JC009]WED22878.1 hypothetical protein L3Q72_05650 [Vibrio sp. JC009]